MSVTTRMTRNGRPMIVMREGKIVCPQIGHGDKYGLVQRTGSKEKKWTSI